MQAYCLSMLDELAPYADDWDRLAGGVPLRSWAWLSTWWKNYGPSDYTETQCDRLAVVCVFDNRDALVGVAPWYLHHCVSQGRVLRQMGDGEVCSDYVGLLARADQQHQVAETLAEWLVENQRSADGNYAAVDSITWDVLDLTGIDFEDLPTNMLLQQLRERGKIPHQRRAASCWRLNLPATWEEYLAILSKNRRKQLRRLQRSFIDSGRAVLRSVERMGDLPQATEILVDLHQRRRCSMGEPGCFASKRFEAFHREVMPKLLAAGQLQLHWLELDGKPAAAEYSMAGNDVWYAYQSGVDPDQLGQHPGTLCTILTAQRAIEQGYRALDFMRGDEPYKLSWRAAPRRQIDTHVVADRASSRLRHGLWMAGSNVKQWIKGGKQWATANV